MCNSNVLANLLGQLASPAALNRLIAILRGVDLVRYSSNLEKRSGKEFTFLEYIYLHLKTPARC